MLVTKGRNVEETRRKHFRQLYFMAMKNKLQNAVNEKSDHKIHAYLRELESHHLSTAAEFKELLLESKIGLLVGKLRIYEPKQIKYKNIPALAQLVVRKWKAKLSTIEEPEERQTSKQESCKVENDGGQKSYALISAPCSAQRQLSTVSKMSSNHENPLPEPQNTVPQKAEECADVVHVRNPVISYPLGARPAHAPWRMRRPISSDVASPREVATQKYPAPYSTQNAESVVVSKTSSNKKRSRPVHDEEPPTGSVEPSDTALLKVGDCVIAKDKYNQWHAAKLVDKDELGCRVHFVNWNKKFDESILFSSGRIRYKSSDDIPVPPPSTKTEYSRPKNRIRHFNLNLSDSSDDDNDDYECYENHENKFVHELE